MQVLHILHRYNPALTTYSPCTMRCSSCFSLRDCGWIVLCSFSRCPTIRLETLELLIWLRYAFTLKASTWEIMHQNQWWSCFKFYFAYCVILCNLRTLCLLNTVHFQILGEFALTHEEVVERRKLLLERTQSVSAAMSNINTHANWKLILNIRK